MPFCAHLFDAFLCDCRPEYDQFTSHSPEQEACGARASRRSVDLGSFSQWRARGNVLARAGEHFQSPQPANLAQQPSTLAKNNPASQPSAKWRLAPHIAEAQPETMRRMSMDGEQGISSGSRFHDYQCNRHSAAAQEKQAFREMSTQASGVREVDPLSASILAVGNRQWETSPSFSQASFGRMANQRYAHMDQVESPTGPYPVEGRARLP